MSILYLILLPVSSTSTSAWYETRHPIAPLLRRSVSEIVESAVLLADISGFSKLSEKLRNEHGDLKGNEAFANQVGSAFSALVLVTQRYQGVGSFDFVLNYSYNYSNYLFFLFFFSLSSNHKTKTKNNAGGRQICW